MLAGAGSDGGPSAQHYSAMSLPQMLSHSVSCSSNGWASFLSSARHVLLWSFIVQGTYRRDGISNSSAPTCRARLQEDSIFVSFVRVRGAALPSFASRRCCLFAARSCGGVAGRLSASVLLSIAQVQMEA